MTETRSRTRDAQSSVPAGVSLEGPGIRSVMDRSPEEEDMGLGALMDDRADAAVGSGRPEVRAIARHQKDDPAAVMESHDQG